MSILRLLDWRRRGTMDESWSILDDPDAPKKRAAATDFYPLVDTLRLYAGWLLAWYFVIYALGAYQFTRALPLQSGLLEQLFFSPLILEFSLFAFLFLLLSDLHRFLGRGTFTGIVLAVAGVFLFAAFRANM